MKLDVIVRLSQCNSRFFYLANQLLMDRRPFCQLC